MGISLVFPVVYRTGKEYEKMQPRIIKYQQLYTSTLEYLDAACLLCIQQEWKELWYHVILSSHVHVQTAIVHNN